MALQYNAENLRPAGALKLPEPAATRAAWLDARAASAEAASAAASQTYASLVESVQVDRGDRDRYIGQCRERGQQPDPRTLDDLNAAVERAEGALRMHQESTAGAKVVNAAVEEINGVVRKVGKGLPDSVKIHNAKPRADIGALVDKLGALKNERLKVDQAAVPYETAAAQISAEVDRLADEGAPRARLALDFTGPHARARLRHEVSITWPQEMSRAEPAFGGELPLVTNSVALIAWAMRDQIKKSLLADLYAQYQNVDLALDPADRRKRLAEIDSQILIIEHEVAHLAWALINQGDDSAVRFLDGLDPRAILGVVA